MIENIITYEAETLLIYKRNRSKYNAVEMKYWRSGYRVVQTDRISNEEINRRIMREKIVEDNN